MMFSSLTNVALYVVTEDKSFRSFYSRMVHVTCLAHALQIVEEVGAKFPQVDTRV
jgi:hypothetical protein